MYLRAMFSSPFLCQPNSSLNTLYHLKTLFLSTDLLLAEVIAGEGKDVDEDPDQGGDAQGQPPGGEKVQGKVLDPD